MVDGIIEDVMARPRNLDYKKKETKPPAPVLWVQTFGSDTDAIQKVIKDANEAIKQSPTLEG